MRNLEGKPLAYEVQQRGLFGGREIAPVIFLVGHFFASNFSLEKFTIGFIAEFAEEPQAGLGRQAI
jgi:hypothetical protein